MVPARLTQDLDVVYRRDAENLRRLATALDGQDPYPRGVAPGLPFVLDAETLRSGLNFTLVSNLAELEELLIIRSVDQSIWTSDKRQSDPEFTRE